MSALLLGVVCIVVAGGALAFFVCPPLAPLLRRFFALPQQATKQRVGSGRESETCEMSQKIDIEMPTIGAEPEPEAEPEVQEGKGKRKAKGERYARIAKGKRKVKGERYATIA